MTGRGARVRLRAVAAAIALCLLGPTHLAIASSTADVMSPQDVVTIDRDLDGSIVTVEGEVVGEHLRAAGGGRWVNIVGEGVGLGIWVTEEMAERIENFGGYRRTGDTVRVVGVVNIACEQHAGEFDVHAESFEIVSRGGPRETEIDLVRGAVGVAGMAVALVLWHLYRRRRERRML